MEDSIIENSTPKESNYDLLVKQMMYVSREEMDGLVKKANSAESARIDSLGNLVEDSSEDIRELSEIIADMGEEFEGRLDEMKDDLDVLETTGISDYFAGELTTMISDQMETRMDPRRANMLEMAMVKRRMDTIENRVDMLIAFFAVSVLGAGIAIVSLMDFV